MRFITIFPGEHYTRDFIHSVLVDLEDNPHEVFNSERTGWPHGVPTAQTILVRKFHHPILSMQGALTRTQNDPVNSSEETKSDNEKEGNSTANAGTAANAYTYSLLAGVGALLVFAGFISWSIYRHNLVILQNPKVADLTKISLKARELLDQNNKSPAERTTRESIAGSCLDGESTSVDSTTSNASYSPKPPSGVPPSSSRLAMNPEVVLDLESKHGGGERRVEQ